MQDDAGWPSLTEEEMTLLLLIFKMQAERGKNVSLAELERGAKDTGLIIADHILSYLNILIADKGLAIWSDGERSGENGERILTNSFVELTECGKMICAIIMDGGRKESPSVSIPVSIDVISNEEVRRVLGVVKEILNDPEESDFPLYASNIGRCLRMDFGKSLMIVDILRDAGCITVSSEGIVTMTEEQMRMEYPPKK